MASPIDVRNAALRRKADALEAAQGDPAKVAELRSMLPVERKTEPKTTAEQSKPEVKAEAKPAEKPAEAPAKPAEDDKPKMAATRGMAKPEAEDKTGKA